MRSPDVNQNHEQSSIEKSGADMNQGLESLEPLSQTQADGAPHDELVNDEFGYRARIADRSLPVLQQIIPRCESIRVSPHQHTTACAIGCQCHCHAIQRVATPKTVDRILGRMFIDYAGLPILNNKCNDDLCAKAQSAILGVEYWFPLGFCWSQILRLHLGYQPNIGPQVALSTLRQIPDSAPAVAFALNGNIDGLKDLFAHGLASPRDVSATRGYSILRWALYGKKYETCKFLVHAGADPEYRPISQYDNNPRNKAWDFILQGGLSREAVELLSCLRVGSDFVEEQNYFKAHKIVLGLSFSSLQEDLAQNPDAINCVDALGRTPLIWAAARGNAEAIILLLGAGADPNAIDIQYTSAVSYAAERDHIECVRLLLEAGAELDPIFDDGTKIGSPLNCAARNATNPLILKTLLNFGADIEASGVEGITPLMHVARTDRYDFALLLLENGADLNAASSMGQTALTTAITYNSHRVLQLLLDRWIGFSDCPRLKSRYLLEITALYADITTIHILTAADHIKFSYDSGLLLGDSIRQIRQRVDGDEKIAHAFEELLSIIGRDVASLSHRKHDSESGTWES